MSARLRDKVVLITGPARGIGAEVARRLAREGARLALVGMEPDRLEALAGELGGRHLWYECDVTRQADLDRAVAGAVRALGGIDVVVANAGIASNGTVAVTPVDALARVVDVNLTGVIRTVHATLPQLTARRGYVLIVSSASAIAAMPGIATYAATKAGVDMFASNLRLELRHAGVQVGVVYPSWIDTDLVRDIRADLPSFEAALRRLPWPFNQVTSVEECAAAITDAIAARRRKTFVPRVLAPLAAVRQLLSSPAAEWVLGRAARRLVPESEREVQSLGRAFGRSSVGLGERLDR